MRLRPPYVLPAILSIIGMAGLPSCKVTDISDEEQSASLAPYSGHTISGAPLGDFFGGRTATLLGAEGLEIRDREEASTFGDPGPIETFYTIRHETSEALEIGTGFAIDSRGYFLTAGHCIGEREIYAHYVNSDRKAVIERVQPIWVRISSLPEIDLALFRVEGKPFETFQWAESFDIGDPVFSAGTTFKVNESEDPPFQFTTDSFAGEVKKTRDVNLEKTTFQLIWHRSPVRRGNSGGPLVNENGELIGVNYAATNPIQRAAGSDITPMAYAIRPDREWLRKLIEDDWATRQEN